MTNCSVAADGTGVSLGVADEDGRQGTLVLPTECHGHRLVSINVQRFSGGEIDPFFGGSQTMVAYASEGKSLGAQGAPIAVPGHKAGSRFVSNIDKIEVHDSH